jgi:hypothetical protein
LDEESARGWAHFDEDYQDHFEAVAGGVGLVGVAQTAEFVARDVVELDVDHVTL